MFGGGGFGAAGVGEVGVSECGGEGVGCGDGGGCGWFLEGIFCCLDGVGLGDVSEG